MHNGCGIKCWKHIRMGEVWWNGEDEMEIVDEM
jgi:hypothetical protein